MNTLGILALIAFGAITIGPLAFAAYKSRKLAIKLAEELQDYEALTTWTSKTTSRAS